MIRSDKVSHAIKREVSNIIHNEMKDPRLGFITITEGGAYRRPAFCQDLLQRAGRRGGAQKRAARRLSPRWDSSASWSPKG